ncbi:MAG: NAD(P)/FAD-dependent oxidoreductase [Rhizobiaceae bacterium]
MFDVIIIGGSYAGLSAAMPVARARRKLAVVDAGLRRNRFAKTSHGFIGRDGHAPGAIAAEAKAQLLAYPTVEWIDGTAVNAGGEVDAFRVELGDGRRLEGRRIVLATGMEDILPDMPGLKEQWGVGAVICPYCHGYEFQQGALGVLATGPNSIHQALLVPDWGATTLFVNGAIAEDQLPLADLTRRNVAIERTPVVSIDGEPGQPVVKLADDRSVPLAGLFVATTVRMPDAVIQGLGCATETTRAGAAIKADMMKQTSVPGVFACGDITRGNGSVPLAVGDGAMAGAAVHRSLVFPETLPKAA